MSTAPILLIEDNDDDAALVRLAMREIGAPREVVVARDGSEALEYLFGTEARTEARTEAPAEAQAGSARPWIVLLDLKLRRISGLETLASLRADERTRTLPVIVFTSSREERDVVASYRLGANSYVRKPHDFEELTSILEKIVTYWSANELPPAQAG